MRSLSKFELESYLEAISYQGAGEVALRSQIELGQIQVMKTLDTTISFPTGSTNQMSQYVAVAMDDSDQRRGCQACIGRDHFAECQVLPDIRHVHSFLSSKDTEENNQEHHQRHLTTSSKAALSLVTTIATRDSAAL